jgi:hypothetical protein
MTIYEYINDIFIYIIILVLVILILLYHFKPDLFAVKHLDNFENTCNNSCSKYLKNGAYLTDGKTSSLSALDLHREKEISIFKRIGDYYLKHFYIMTAYNCCSSGNINGCVELCALEHCMKMGARCLDFEIYSKNETPIIATSSKEDSEYTKESYNHLVFKDVINSIKKHAFSSTVPNSNDPLFIHFRIKSNNEHTIPMLNKMYDIIQSEIPTNYRLSGKYGNGCKNYDIVSIPIKRLKRKIIFMCDFNNQVDQSKLYSLINISAICDNFSVLTETDFRSKSPENMKHSSKRSLILSIPDKNNHNNISLKSFMEQKNIGLSMIGMRFQKYDTTAENQSFHKYLDFFSNNAFVLKQETLLDVPRILAKEKPQSKGNSYGTTTFNPLPGVNLPIGATQI